MNNGKYHPGTRVWNSVVEREKKNLDNHSHTEKFTKMKWCHQDIPSHLAVYWLSCDINAMFWSKHNNFSKDKK